MNEMDEMDLLRDVLTRPGPGEDMVAKRRAEFQHLMHQRPGGGRASRRLAGFGLATVAAVAVAAAVILSDSPTAPPTAHHHLAAAHHLTAGHHHPAPVTLTAKQVLLTAAASSAQAPAQSGTYWYVRTWAEWGNGSTLSLAESWSKRDGETWIRDQKTGGKVFKLPPPPPGMTAPGPYFLGGREMTVSQIEHLPTSPAALTRWIVRNAAEHSSKTGGPSPSKAREKEDIFESLDSLVSQLPSPPPVRATAFRALAALPGITSLGPRDGGQAVQYAPDNATIVIDPSTGKIIATNFFVASDGSTFWQPTVNARIIGEWTNTLP